MIKQWYSAAELAEMKIPGFPTSERRARDRAERDEWISKQVPGKGGRTGLRTEFQPSAEVMAIIKQRALHTMVQSVPAKVQSKTADLTVQNTVLTVLKAPVSTELKDWQRQVGEARAAICAEVRRLASVGGTERAIRTVIDMAAQGTLPEHLQQLVLVANAKAGQSRALSRTSIFRWLKDSEGGIAKLAPKVRDSNAIPAWAPALLSLYRQPQKPALKWVMEQLPGVLPTGVEVPSYFAANRFLKKISKTEVQRGRMGSREIKNIRPFVRRDTSQMWPAECYTADGHTFDAEVAHPAHGRPFRPEITTVLDIATRRAVGWSTGLAETTWGVLDALLNACLTGGIPAIFYVDNGSGFKNEAMSNEATGFMARLDITLTHSLPYNSQARGIEERSHQTIWVRGAKTLPTYMGAPMDREAKQKSFKVTRADIKNTGTSRLLMPWNEFVQWCQLQVDDYNNRPHRALPKVRDEITGKVRHQSPNEAWARAVEDGKTQDWAPVMVEPNEADDLFRPYKEAKTTRAEVRLFGNTYFHPNLEHYHGEMVRVGYDIHDASRVWVREQSGRLICVAGFEANKRSYFPQSFIEQAVQKRAEGRIKRAQAKIDEAQEELDAPLLIEHQQAYELPVMAVDQIEEVREMVPANVIEMPKAKAARPMFDTDAGKYRWLMGNADQITSVDDAWINYYRLTAEWEDIFGDREVATR